MEKYFYSLLVPLASAENLTDQDFIDWGNTNKYIQAVGIGECAGVVIDLVATLLLEAQEKVVLAQESFEKKLWSDAAYHAYASLVNGAKALLVAENKKTNTHAGIINQFDEVFVETNKIVLNTDFKNLVYQIKENEPTELFVKKYIAQAATFYDKIEQFRIKELKHAV